MQWDDIHASKTVDGNQVKYLVQNVCWLKKMVLKVSPTKKKSQKVSPDLWARYRQSKRDELQEKKTQKMKKKMPQTPDLAV